MQIRGVVQGVGFRPFVYRLAIRHKAVGWVINTSGSVDIEAQAPKAALDAFLSDLQNTLPPLARIDHMAIEWLPPAHYEDFSIRDSVAQAGRYQLVPPDIATCADCRQELFDSADRRAGYPFINCTNCGPRFTIIEDVPYDRPMTTMKVFPLCPDCEGEYRDPLNRRFHAQPNACAVCGPNYWVADSEGRAVGREDAFAQTVKRLGEGQIGALRGLGGFHLACDAGCAEVVALLRTRKRRPGKPLAVMMRDLEMVRAHCDISAAEADLLSSPAAPIVVLRWHLGESSICGEVAPGQLFLGVMLPYTPFHHLIMASFGGPVVMTSGNLSEEPIAIANDEALVRLGEIADFFVLHNREILNRCDDSVLLVEDGPRPLRRARGYAPDPLALGANGPQVLACGAAEKNTVCLTQVDEAFLSHHIGDLENVETFAHFEETIDHYQRLFRIVPEAVAHDLHPDYLSSRYANRWAADRDLPAIGVQHHHAHVAACLAEHRLEGPALGLAFDGTGYGPDGTIWGGELLHVEGGEFRRLGYIEQIPMPGGEAAIRRPARMALSLVRSSLGLSPADCSALDIPGLRDGEAELIYKQLERGINSPLTSSAGRLFDAISALLGVRGIAQYEAQAAIELEMAAHTSTRRPTGLFPVVIEEEGSAQLRLGPLVAGVLEAQKKGEPVADISWRFHRTMAEVSFQLARRGAAMTGCHQVAATGGVFQNRLLLAMVLARFKESKLQLLTHSRVPCNDGSIALGQAVIARARLSGGTA
jgi:hydrogenase maturation protein HypF